MINFSFNEDDYKNIVLLRMLLQQISEEQLEEEGYQFTYKGARIMLDYIDYLESYVDYLEDN